MGNMKKAVSVLVVSLSIILLMIPLNSVLADHPLLDPEPENNTIPLWAQLGARIPSHGELIIKKK